VPVTPAGGTPSVGGAPPAGGGAGPAPVDPQPAIPEPTLILSGEGAYWQVGELVAGGSNATVTVNDSQELQDWYGFGGTVNEKGWDAMTHLSDADRDLAIRLLFDKADGAAFTHVRIPIGSSDYALSRYSLAETANDFEMNDFSIERDRQALIPYIKAAQAVNPNLWFWASPWSPPPWMKSNNAFDRGSMKNDAQTMGAHALYLARFVEEYALEGIDVKAVHPQNEAGYEQDYPSCAWSSSQMVDYIANYLAPTFSERGLPTEIWCGTLSNPSLDHQIGQAVMGNSAARAVVKGVGLQWGLDGSIGTYTNYGVHVMQTEHKCGNYPWETGTYRSDRAPNDHAYALESWGFFKTWISGGVNSYMAWNMVLDTIGRSLDDVRPWNQNALLTVDTAQGRLIPTPYYYVFRHLSQYVEPGSVRVQTQGGDALAWKNPDGSIVAVMHNSGGNAADTTLSIGGSTYQFSIPARGWATANWQP
jgi:glucosylceramidase